MVQPMPLAAADDSNELCNGMYELQWGAAG